MEIACSRCDYSYTDSHTDPVNHSTGLAYEKRSNGWFVVGIGTCGDLHITVPAVNEQGNKVVGIATNAFHRLPILSITVEDGVKILESFSISECAKLTSVTLPASVVPEGKCFSALSALETLSMPFHKAIPYYFSPASGNEFLEVKVSISEFPYSYTGAIPLSLRTVHVVGSSCATAALQGCSMIKTATVAQTIRQLPNGIFSGCTALESITFSDSLTSIGNRAFAGTAIREIRIPDSVVLSLTTDSMLADCKNLVSVTLPKNATAIGLRMFMGCTALSFVEIPASVRSIGDGAFFQTAITSIVLPDAVTELYVGIFADCSKLETVTLPKSLTLIENKCFQNCTSLKTLRLPATVTEIGNNAFEGCGLTAIELPEGLKKIGENAFSNCNALESVILPASLTFLGGEAFANCVGLKAVEFRSLELPTNGSGIFHNTPLLETVALPETLTRIPASFFAGATGLKSITIPKTVTHIYNSAFQNCTALETVDLSGAAITYGDGITPWNTYVFAGCTSLKVILNDENVVQNYDETVFQNTPLQTNENGLCIGNGLLIRARLSNGVTSITVPATVRTVRATAFYQSYNLTEVIFSEGLHTLENAVFSECNQLKRVVLPDSLTQIHENAFGSCNITDLECGASVASRLANVKLPATLKTICFRGTAAEWNALFPTLPPNLAEITVLFTEE